MIGVGGGGGPEVGGGGPAVAPATAPSAVKGLEARVSDVRAKADAKETSEAAQRSEAKTPSKVAKDPRFKEIRDNVQAQNKDGKLGTQEVESKAVSEYYSKLAQEQSANGISDEISKDPDYKSELDKVRTQAQKDGRNLTPGQAQQEALANYLKQKDIAEEAAASAEGSDAEKRIADLEKKVEGLTAQNKEFIEKISQLTIAMTVLTDKLEPVVKNLYDNEQDPKKKEALGELLAKIIAIAALSIFTEGAKLVVPPSR